MNKREYRLRLRELATSVASRALIDPPMVGETFDDFARNRKRVRYTWTIAGGIHGFTENFIYEDTMSEFPLSKLISEDDIRYSIVTFLSTRSLYVKPKLPA